VEAVTLHRDALEPRGPHNRLEVAFARAAFERPGPRTVEDLLLARMKGVLPVGAHATVTSAPIEVPITSKGSETERPRDRGKLLQFELQGDHATNALVHASITATGGPSRGGEARPRTGRCDRV